MTPTMREKFDPKRLLPFALAVVIYAVIALIYFTPQFGGDVIVQGDIMQYKGMTQDIKEARDKSGVDPQWSGSMFGGMPAYLINVEYPAQIIKRCGAVVTDMVATPAAFIFFAMLSMWLMLVMMGMNAYVAIVGGALYGLSTYFMLIIEAGHVTKMWALVYAPAMMGAIYAALRSGRLCYFALAALFTSLEVGANHPQVTYYFLVAAAALWISELYFAWRGEQIREFARRTALIVVAGLLGVASNFSPLWYTAQHTPDTLRGGSELVGEGAKGGGGLDLEYATAWSYGRLESMNMLIPDFMGRDSGMSFSEDGAVAKSLMPYNAADLAQQLPTYWGDQPFTAGPTYLGAVVLLLACIGFGLARGRERWWIVGVSIFMLLLAWGSNMMWFTELMFKILPAYNKFRTVSMTLVVVQWSVPLLATYALSQLWRGEWRREELIPVVGWSAAATGGVAILLAIFGGGVFDFGQPASYEMLINAQFPDQIATEVSRAMAVERGDIMAADGWRTAGYIAVAAAMIVAFAYGRVSKMVMVAAVGVVGVVDLMAVDMRFLSHDDFTAPRSTRIVASASDLEIMEDRGESGEREYRVFNLAVSPFNDASTSYFHRSIGGYHGAKLARYQDVIDNYLVAQNGAVLDMLNTRYIISPSREVVRRPSPLGAAWLVERVERVESPNEEIARIGEVDLSRTAVVAKDQGIEHPKFGSGEIVIEEYAPNYQRYRYNAEEAATAVFSEIYYNKGWRAFIDGVESPYFRANYILRAMELPAGEHTVEWRFRAPRWGVVEGVTLIASLIIILSFVSLLIWSFYGKKTEPQE